MRQRAVSFAGEVFVPERGFGVESISVQPVQQRQIHAHAQHRVLRGVHVHVGEGRQYQRVAVIDDGRALVSVGQNVEQTDDFSAVRNDVSVFQNVQLSRRGSVDNIAL